MFRMIVNVINIQVVGFKIKCIINMLTPPALFFFLPMENSPFTTILDT